MPPQPYPPPQLSLSEKNLDASIPQLHPPGEDSFAAWLSGPDDFDDPYDGKNGFQVQDIFGNHESPGPSPQHGLREGKEQRLPLPIIHANERCEIDRASDNDKGTQSQKFHKCVEDNAPSLRSLSAPQKVKPRKASYFLDKGIFSAEQKHLIQQFSHESPSTVIDRLRSYDPALPHSYRQIKGAVENEWRKKNRRQANGPWTEEELDTLKQNIEKAPKELVRLLHSNVAGSSKNVDQVRDMKNLLAQKRKKRTG